MSDHFFLGKKNFVLKLCRGGADNAMFVDGVISGNNYNHMFYADFQMAPTLNGKSYGEYLVVKKTQDGYEVNIDPIGYYNLYYSVVSSFEGDALFLSNDFRSLSDALASDRKLDFDAWYPVLASQHNIFSNNYSDHTSDSRIKLLQPFHSIIYKNGSLSLSKQDILCHVDDYNSYLAFMEKGIQEVCDNMYSSVGNKNHFTELYLSGGKDSRVCLALAMKSLGEGKFNCQTAIPNLKENRPAVEKDVLLDDYKIASHITKKEGLELNASFPSVKYYLKNNAYHRLMESWKSNVYFQGYSSNANVSVNRYQLNQIWGGSGEMLRATKYFSSLSRKVSFSNSKCSVKDDASLMFDTIVNPSRSPSQHARSKDFFLSKFISLDGENIQQKLDSLFMLNRNVFHSGKHRQKFYQNTNIFLPFSNINFLKASRCLPYEEHEVRKLHSDIIEKCYQRLKDYPYTGDLEAGGLISDGEVTNLIREHSEKKIRQQKKNCRDQYEQSFCDYAIEYVDGVLEELSDRAGVTSRLQKYIMNKMKRKDRVSLTVLSKVSAIAPPPLDALDEMRFPATCYYQM